MKNALLFFLASVFLFACSTRPEFSTPEPFEVPALTPGMDFSPEGSDYIHVWLNGKEKWFRSDTGPGELVPALSLRGPGQMLGLGTSIAAGDTLFGIEFILPPEKSPFRKNFLFQKRHSYAYPAAGLEGVNIWYEIGNGTEKSAVLHSLDIVQDNDSWFRLEGAVSDPSAPGQRARIKGAFECRLSPVLQARGEFEIPVQYQVND